LAIAQGDEVTPAGQFPEHTARYNVTPQISVIMPTHNRAHLLEKTLVALTHQTVSSDCYELVLVADGCTDTTVDVVRQMELPYRLTFIEQPALGVSAARNRGVGQAKASLLLFLDDDKEATPGLIEAHLRAHEAEPGRVILGYYPIPAEVAGTAPLAVQTKNWWDRFFAELNTPAHRFTFKDFCAGNVSLSTELFLSVQGFDETVIDSSEDYEFGARLLARGVRFQYVPKALSWHNECRTYEAALRRARAEGYNEARIVQKNVEFFWSFNIHRMSQSQFWLFEPVWRFLWKHPQAADLVAATLHPLVRWAERRGMHSVVSRLTKLTLGHAYWRGVHAALGSLAAYVRLYQDAPLIPESHHAVEIDIATDLGRLDQILAERSADSALLFCLGTPLGRIWPVVGGERLSGPHVREIVVARFPAVLLGLIVQSHLERHAAAAQPISSGTTVEHAAVEHMPIVAVRDRTDDSGAVQAEASWGD
jgi:GT2 family glycosyltransferase